MFEISERIKKIPPYLFVEIDKKKKQLIEKGEDIIDFGIGDPDQPTPLNIIEAMKKAVENPKFHKYPFGKGTYEFRKAISDYYKKIYDVEINPNDEICVLIGSKEGIAHFPLCFINPGDISFVPEPGYPVYSIGTLIAGGQSYFLPLKEENNFLPDFGKIPENILERAKIFYLNYPNNPTGTFADREFLKEVINFCKKNQIILVYDAAYSEIFFEERPVNIFSIEKAKDVAIEFNSLSKTYNMTGWRIGWACGNKYLISALAKIKENIDSGTFEAIQYAGIEALKGPQESVENMRKIYRKRRDIFADGLRKTGFDFILPKGTFYFWVNVKESSIKFVDFLLENCKIISTPGIGFGPSGEGYVRFSLTIDEDKIKKAIERMEKIWVK